MPTRVLPSAQMLEPIAVICDQLIYLGGRAVPLAKSGISQRRDKEEH